MGIDYYFHLQHFKGHVWTTPPELDDPTDRVTHGYLTWFDDDDVRVCRLFVREDALFPLRRETPPDFVITELYRSSYRRPDESDAEFLASLHDEFESAYQGWIGFDDLGLDEWPTTDVLVLKRVPSEVAPLFKDGDQPFPRDALLDAGWSVDNVDALGDMWYFGYDIQYGFNGYGLTQEPVRSWHNPRQRPSSELLVSWKTTLADFIGEWSMEAFNRARKIAPDSQLRLLFLLY